KIEKQRKIYEKELYAFQEADKFLTKQKEVNEHIQSQLESMNVRLQEENPDTADFTHMEEIIAERHEVVYEDAPISYKKQDTAKKQSEDTNEIVTNHPAQYINIDSMIHVIDETRKSLKDMTAFDSILQELQTKRHIY